MQPYRTWDTILYAVEYFNLVETAALLIFVNFGFPSCCSRSAILRDTPSGQLLRQILSFIKLRRNRVRIVLIGTPAQSARS